MKQLKPVRIQRSRQHKMVSPNGLPIVYVGRPSKLWGNPIIVGAYDFDGKTQFTANYAKKHYEQLMRLRKKISKLEEKETGSNFYYKTLEQLRGKNLSCWCKLSAPCHADVLLKLAATDYDTKHKKV